MTTKTKLLSSSLLSSFALAVLVQPALAQETVPPDNPVSVEEFVVTGTRLRLQDFVSPNPVSTVTSDAIERSGITNVTDLMKDYPALVGSSDSQTFSDAGLRSNVGLNLLNLRNLGVDRTLVLVDGRRHVAGTPGSAAVDTNSIPVGLIERVRSSPAAHRRSTGPTVFRGWSTSSPSATSRGSTCARSTAGPTGAAGRTPSSAPWRAATSWTAG